MQFLNQQQDHDEKPIKLGFVCWELQETWSIHLILILLIFIQQIEICIQVFFIKRRKWFPINGRQPIMVIVQYIICIIWLQSQIQPDILKFWFNWKWDDNDIPFQIKIIKAVIFMTRLNVITFHFYRTQLIFFNWRIGPKDMNQYTIFEKILTRPKYFLQMIFLGNMCMFGLCFAYPRFYFVSTDILNWYTNDKFGQFLLSATNINYIHMLDLMILSMAIVINSQNPKCFRFTFDLILMTAILYLWYNFEQYFMEFYDKTSCYIFTDFGWDNIIKIFVFEISCIYSTLISSKRFTPLPDITIFDDLKNALFFQKIVTKFIEYVKSKEEERENEMLVTMLDLVILGIDNHFPEKNEQFKNNLKRSFNLLSGSSSKSTRKIGQNMDNKRDLFEYYLILLMPCYKRFKKTKAFHALYKESMQWEKVMGLCYRE